MNQKTYWNKQGSRTDFILSNAENRPRIDETLALMKSYRSFTPQQFKAVQQEVE